MAELEQKGAAPKSPVEHAPAATAQHPASVSAAGSAAVQRILSATDDKLTGQLIASNNPEAVYSPGVILRGMSVQKGAVGIYLHHANHTSAAMDFFAVVRPQGSGEHDEHWSGSSASGLVNNVRTADPDYRTARATLGAKTTQDSKGTGEREISLGSCAAASNLHSVEASPLLDGRFDLQLDGPATIDIVCRKRGDSTALDKLPDATGNTKMATADTGGRAAGLYRGASYADAPPPIDMSAGSQPFEYGLTAVSGKGAAAPPALERKSANVLSAAALGAILARAATVDAAVVEMLEQVYHVNATWLADAGIWKDGKIDPKAATFAKDVSYEHMIIALLAAANVDRSAHPGKGAFDATHCATQIAANGTIGAAKDLGNYGTVYDLTFTLLNSGAAGTAHVALDNRNGAPYRGASELDGAFVDLFHDSQTKGGAAGSMAIGPVSLPAASKESPSSTTVHVKIMSPGQIASGQVLTISPRG